MNKTQKLNTPYQVKSNFATKTDIDESSRVIKAVVNTYNFFDSDQDVLRKGCAAKSILERGSKSSAADKVVHALFHDLTRIVGKSMLEAETTIDGKEVLYTESYLPETTAGEDTLINYKAGIYNQHSIGFRYVNIEYIEKDDDLFSKGLQNLINPEAAEAAGYFFDVKEINWYEYSTVAFGANKLTPYLGTKSANKLDQYHAIITKMNTLVKKANRHEVKNKKLFKLQYKQLEQMIYELANSEPTPKDTIIKDSRPVDDTLSIFYNTLNK